VTLIHSISPNAIRLTLPSSASRLASRNAPIIPMGPNPSFTWLFRGGERYATKMAHRMLPPETPSSLGRGRPTNFQTMERKISPTTSSPIIRATTHAITPTAASGRSAKKAPITSSSKATRPTTTRTRNNPADRRSPDYTVVRVFRRASYLPKDSVAGLPEAE
jgi:hypothetical protein